LTDNLTAALAVLGGVVIAGVLAHGAWQARRASPRSRAADAAPTPRGEPREPVLGPEVGDGVPGAGDPYGVAASADGDGGLAPSFDGEGRDDVGFDAPAARAATRRSLPRIDPLIDAVVTLRLDAPVTGEAVIAQMPGSRRAGSKPFLIEGLGVDDGDWEQPTAGQRYSELQAGVQLSNRSGALNEIEYSEFVQKIEVFAESLGAMADFPDMLDVVARARELDAFASEHDAQMALRLRARSVAWGVGHVVMRAARQGFVSGGLPGRLVLPAADEGAAPVLTLTFDPQAALAEDPSRSAIRELTLGLDVAQTPGSLQPFSAWRERAQALAADLDADVVDDRGIPLTPEGFAFIGGELARLYEALDTHDLAAGSPAARRLFS
jgi:hypothetical protein